MKLADAIRKGSQQRPQAFGDFFEKVEGQILGSCAIGAAIEGYFGDTTARIEELHTAFPILDKVVEGPEQGMRAELCNVITDLNDMCDWTRECIADWVETIEENLDGQTMATPKEDPKTL